MEEGRSFCGSLLDYGNNGMNARVCRAGGKALRRIGTQVIEEMDS